MEIVKKVELRKKTMKRNSFCGEAPCWQLEKVLMLSEVTFQALDKERERDYARFETSLPDFVIYEEDRDYQYELVQTRDWKAENIFGEDYEEVYDDYEEICEDMEENIFENVVFKSGRLVEL